VPRRSPGARCALTAPFHPCHARPVARTPFGGLFSVALSCGSPRPVVDRHPALWCPDFPRQPPFLRGRRVRPSGSGGVDVTRGAGSGNARTSYARGTPRRRDRAFRIWFDFYKPLRDAMVQVHAHGKPKKTLDDLVAGLTDSRRLEACTAVVRGHKKFARGAARPGRAALYGAASGSGGRPHLDPVPRGELGQRVDVGRRRRRRGYLSPLGRLARFREELVDAARLVGDDDPCVTRRLDSLEGLGREAEEGARPPVELPSLDRRRRLSSACGRRSGRVAEPAGRQRGVARRWVARTASHWSREPKGEQFSRGVIPLTDRESEPFVTPSRQVRSCTAGAHHR
jgi:hypothetical protein